MRPALLVVNPQTGFFEDDNGNPTEFRRVLPKVNAAIAFFRKQRWPVIFLQHISANKPVGSQAWSIYAGFDCRREDVQLNKAYANAFWQTELDQRLRALGVDYVVVAGLIAEQCVLSTYRGARERNYRAAILQDGIAGSKHDDARFVYDISTTVTLSELQLMLANGQAPADGGHAPSALRA